MPTNGMDENTDKAIDNMALSGNMQLEHEV
jgi:hypothetical protein